MVVVDLPALPDERGRWGAEGEDSWGDAVAWLAREPGAFRPPGPPRVVAFVAHNGLCNRLAGLGETAQHRRFRHGRHNTDG